MRCRPLICPFQDLLNYLPENVSSFDVGCGTGYWLSLIATEKRPSALGGIEISDALVRFATERVTQAAPNVPKDLCVYDGDHLPENVANYDFVWMVDVLHHIPENKQAPALQQLARQMKPGATLVLKDIDAGRRILCLANKLHDLLSAGKVGCERDRETAAAMLKDAGLMIRASGVKRMWVYPHYWYVCSKPPA